MSLTLMMALAFVCSIESRVIQMELIANETKTILETSTISLAADEETTISLEETYTPKIALSRDEDASIKIITSEDQNSDSEVVLISATPLNSTEKSGNLLLLSTPKIEKPKHLEEENIEESEEQIGEGSGTTEPMETTTIYSTDVETTNTPKVTKLFPVIIPDAEPENSKKSKVLNEMEADKVSDITNITTSTVEIPLDDVEFESNNNSTLKSDEEKVPAESSNIGYSVLVETEPEYVLVEGANVDFEEQFASFTHADSEVHLQPIVQSVEIVPSSVDDSLLEDYVHSW